MNETMRAGLPKPVEFYADGVRFVQYGMSPVRMASLRASARKEKKGTRKNPIIKDGKEYVYDQDGRLMVLEHFDRETVKKNTLQVNETTMREKISRLNELGREYDIPDDECPELTDEEISDIMNETKMQKYAKK